MNSKYNRCLPFVTFKNFSIKSFLIGENISIAINPSSVVVPPCGTFES